MVTFTAAKLKLAYGIQRIIDSLEKKILKQKNKLTKALGGEIPVSRVAKPGRKPRRKMSAVAKAKIAAAAKKRWKAAKAAGKNSL